MIDERQMSGGNVVGGQRARPARTRRRIGRRQIPAFMLAMAVLLAATAVAGAAIKDFFTPRPYPPKVLYTSGKIKMSNSRKGTAIVSMQRMMPGDTVSGTVVIGNRSRVRANYWLKKANLVDHPGTNGGPFSKYLILQVTRLNGTRPPRVLYRGALGAMPTLYLGKFRPRSRATYRFTVTFPDRGPRYDNLYQGCSVSVDFRWYASRLR